MAAPVRKAVFPVAGLGTRFLPASKAIPKEMLTVVDRPLIQHVVDEARAAGIEHFIFVTGRNKSAIEDHFDRQPELEETLAARGKKQELEALLPRPACRRARRASCASRSRSASATRYGAPASSSAMSLSRSSSPTCWCRCKGKGCLAQMLDVYEAHGGNIIAVEPVPEDQTQQLRRGRRRRGQWPRLPHQRHGGEAEARNGALQPHHSRPLYSPARDLRHPRRPRRQARAARSRSPTP